MTNDEKYNAIADSLENRLKTGELTIEQANLINDAAYAKYVEEADEEAELPKEDETKAKKDDKKPEEAACDCGKKDCPICNPETDSEEEEEKPKKKSIKAKKDDKKSEDDKDPDSDDSNEENSETDETHEDDVSAESDDEEEKTESVDINAVKVHVYEAFDAGAISKAEKDLFLAVLE